MSRSQVSASSFITGLNARYYVEEDGSVIAKVVISQCHEGPPGYAHGGALAALLDEAMGAAVWYAGTRVVAVHLSIDYKHAVPLGNEALIAGCVERREGRKVFTFGSISLQDGTLAASASGIFVDSPKVFPEGAPGFSFTPILDE